MGCNRRRIMITGLSTVLCKSLKDLEPLITWDCDRLEEISGLGELKSVIVICIDPFMQYLKRDGIIPANRFGEAANMLLHEYRDVTWCPPLEESDAVEHMRV